MATRYDVDVDFMDMTDERRLWARPTDVRSGLDLTVGHYVVLGSEDADPAVGLIRAIDVDGNIEFEVLRGSVESHRPLLAPA